MNLKLPNNKPSRKPNLYLGFTPVKRAKSVPPKPNSFMADLNTSFVQKIFHITE